MDIKKEIAELKAMKCSALENYDATRQEIERAYDDQINRVYKDCGHEFKRWEPRINMATGYISPMRECKKCGKHEHKSIKDYLVEVQDRIELLEEMISKYEQVISN